MDDSNVYKTSKIVYGSEMYADVKFTTKEEPNTPVIHNAHLTVLLIECPKLFKKMIVGTTYGSCNVVVENIKPVVFELFLEMLYLGMSNKHLKYFEEISSLCQEFEVSVDAKLTEAYQNISVNNVLCILHASINSEIHDDKKSGALKFIGKHYTSVLESAALLDCNRTELSEILQMEEIYDIDFKEEDVMTAVKRYINTNGDKSLSNADMLQSFQDIIKMIRFPTLTPVEFANCLEKNPGIITGDESTAILVGLVRNRTDDLGYSNKTRAITRLDNEPFTQQLKMEISRNVTYNTNYIDQTAIIFTVNRPIVITHAHLYTTSGQSSPRLILDVIKDTVTSIAEGTLPDYNSDSHDVVAFEPLFVLRPNRKYTLHVSYGLDREVSRYYNHQIPSLPYTLISGNVEIKFETMNNMLYSLFVKTVE